MNGKNKGIIYIILAAVGFAFMNLFVKLAGDVPAVEKAFFRNFVAMFFAFFMMKKKKISFFPPKGSKRYIFMRSLGGSIGIFANFYSIGKLCISDASMLNKLSPFWAILFSIFLIKEKPKWYQTLCVCVAFIGALFILKPGVDMMTSFPAFIGLIGGACAGFAYTNVRLASQHGAPGPLIIFCFSAFTCLFSIPLMAPVFVPLSKFQLFSLFMAGVSATVGQVFITAAYSLAPAAEISVYDYTQIIFAAILGALFLGEYPDIYSVVGYFIIIGAGITMFLYNKKHNRILGEQ